MNERLEAQARESLKEGLAKCDETQQMMFKRMYSNGNLELDINEVVDAMPAENFDWAMSQVDTTITKNEACND